MDVARLNFSHGDREDHKRVYDMIRAGADSEGHAVGILADLQGPKIRLGRFADRPGLLEWRTGEQVRITVDDVAGTHDRVSTTYKGLAATPAPTTGCWSTTARSACGSSPSRETTWSAGSPRAARSATTRACRCPGMNVSRAGDVGEGLRGPGFALGLASTSWRCRSCAARDVAGSTR